MLAQSRQLGASNPQLGASNLQAGANGFYASPKWLLDMYEGAGLPISHAYFFEPDVTGMGVPASYAERAAIATEAKYLRVGSRLGERARARPRLLWAPPTVAGCTPTPLVEGAAGPKVHALL